MSVEAPRRGGGLLEERPPDANAPHARIDDEASDDRQLVVGCGAERFSRPTHDDRETAAVKRHVRDHLAVELCHPGPERIAGVEEGSKVAKVFARLAVVVLDLCRNLSELVNVARLA